MPMPEDTSGWGGNDIIFKTLIDEVNPSHIIEVGTWRGQSAITMGKHLKRINSDCNITCVDTWLGSLEFWCGPKHNIPARDLLLKNGYPQVYYQFLSNVVHSGLQDIILPLPLPSNIAHKVLKRQKKFADLIYIDASHEYKDVLSDCINFFPLLRNNGIIFGHDWKWSSDVREAVTEFSVKLKLTLTQDDNKKFWIIRR